METLSARRACDDGVATTVRRCNAQNRGGHGERVDAPRDRHDPVFGARGREGLTPLEHPKQGKAAVERTRAGRRGDLDAVGAEVLASAGARTALDGVTLGSELGQGDSGRGHVDNELGAAVTPAQH